MRRDRFLELHRKCIPSLFKQARKWFDYDEAQEVIAQVIRRIVEHKTYTQIRQDKLAPFLNRAVSFAVRKQQTEQMNKAEKMVRLDVVKEFSPDLSAVKVATSAIVEQVECPFCFKGDVNMYGACALCNTIMPSRMTLHRKQQHIEELSLLVSFDFNTGIDVRNAIAKLTPREQMVVRAVGLGNESLESLAAMSGHGTTNLWRTWLTAKEKLQSYLHEYAEKPLSKRGKTAFRRALQGVEISAQ